MSASFNETYEKYTKEAQKGTCYGADSIRKKVIQLKGPTKCRLAKLNGIADNKGKHCGTQKSQDVPFEKTSANRIAKGNEEQKRQCCISQQVCAFVRTNDKTRNGDIAFERQEHNRAKAENAQYRTYELDYL